MKVNAQPMVQDDGFDYTEDFDGCMEIDKRNFWVNLKCVVGTGGSQTRTLRDECYRFLNAQLEFLVHKRPENCYFVNIFDGDEAASKMRLFRYLLGLYPDVSDRVYVGDLTGFASWLASVRQ